MDGIDQTSQRTGNLSDGLLRIAAQLMLEMHPNRSGGVPVQLDSRLDRDLGLDSLGRVELITRIERSFDVSLPEQLMARAETVRDLLLALRTIQGTIRPTHEAGARLEAPSASNIASGPLQRCRKFSTGTINSTRNWSPPSPVVTGSSRSGS